MKFNFLLLLLLFNITLFAQNNDIKKWRELGYEARINSKIDSSIIYYGWILDTDNDDYDAKLALARLYFNQEDYKKSKAMFKSIYRKDKKDVESLQGLGDIYLNNDKLDHAIKYYSKAIMYLPDYIPLYFKLAKAYSWNDQLDQAIETYKKILKIDDTYSEAYQGIGKMYNWKEHPFSAMKYYKKAIKLDPEEKSIRKEYNEIKELTRLNVMSSTKYLLEREKSYTIDALIENVGLYKRIGDHFDLSLGVLTDYSNRNYTDTDIGDTIRWYNTTMAKVGWLSPNHKVYMYGGYSQSDEQFSSYGLKWKMNYDFNDIKFTNEINGGYGYFYYWNKVGKNEVNDNLSIAFKKFKVSLGYSYGVIDTAFILDIENDIYQEDINPFSGYSTSLTYEITSNPKISISANYSYLNYKYKSNRYYSPLGRKLYGPSFLIYYPIGKFYVYGDLAYNFGSEYYLENIDDAVEKYYLNAANISGNIEFGYDYKKFSASINTGRFYNDYYNNFLVSLNLKYKF